MSPIGIIKFGIRGGSVLRQARPSHHPSYSTWHKAQAELQADRAEAARNTDLVKGRLVARAGLAAHPLISDKA
jgi:hypothetical protein